jgi:hypothetical protein
MDELTTATRNHRRAEARANETREALRRAILAALATGRTQADVARTTGYTRERLRQIAQGR